MTPRRFKTTKRIVLSLLIGLGGWTSPVSAQNGETTISGLFAQADALSEQGDYEKAEAFYQQALTMAEMLYGPDNPDTATALNGLGTLYLSLGDYSKALPPYERVLAIRERSLGPRHPATLSALMNLGLIHYYLDNYENALKLVERALAGQEEVLGQQAPDTAKTVHLLARCYESIGDRKRAETLARRALGILEKTLGPEHVETAGAIDLLASLYDSKGDYANALPLRQRVLAITEKRLGTKHPLTGCALNNIAVHYENVGDYAKALPLYKRALAIRIENLGLYHPSSAQSLNNIALILYLLGDISNARSYLNSCIESQEHQLRSALMMEESLRIAWQQSNWTFNTEVCLLPPEALAQVILRWKGVVLDSLLEDRAFALANYRDGKGRAMLDEIHSLRSRMAKIAFDRERSSEAEALASQISKMQRAMASRFRKEIRSSATVSVADVQAALPDGTVLVEFIQFNDPVLKPEVQRCYGALLLQKNAVPQFVRIEDARTIDRHIREMRTAIASGEASKMENSLNELSDRLWQPLGAALPPEARRIVVGPDGDLNFLSFAALLDKEKRFVGERFNVAYVGSGRDLVRRPLAKAGRSLALFADPRFDQAASGEPAPTVAMRSAERSAFGQVQLPRLPGTLTESRDIETAARSLGWESSLFLEEQATEEQVRSTKSPGILHLATHGFYLNSFSATQPSERGMSVVGLNDDEKASPSSKGVDPMRASGIALTGAESTLRAWSQGTAPEPETDGVLTAEEVGALDLNGTWLVTLSACETGVGEARSGEGVFGLRRAFMIAGAQNLLMTLWPVADDTTSKIMADFYRKALATGDAAGSLAEVQRDWLVKIRAERGLLAAVREAGPFALAVMVNPDPSSPGAKKLPEPQESETASAEVPAETDQEPDEPAGCVTPPEAANVVDPHESGAQGLATPAESPDFTSKAEDRRSEVVAAAAANVPSPQTSASAHSESSSPVLDFNEARSRAMSGDAYAQAVLSIYFATGYRTYKDLEQAAQFALQSAQKGHPLGLYRVGVMRESGLGMAKDEAQGLQLKARSVKGLNEMTDDPYALTALAVMLFRGDVVEKNQAEAARLYKKAADMGYAPAQFNYANCLVAGRGVAKDEVEAAAYWQQARSQNYEPALAGPPR